MDGSFEDLTARFVDEARERSAEIESLLDDLASGTNSADAYAQIREHAHKIKGAAGIFGYDQLKLRAGELEVAAADGPDSPLGPAVSALVAALPS